MHRCLAKDLLRGKIHKYEEWATWTSDYRRWAKRLLRNSQRLKDTAIQAKPANRMTSQALCRGRVLQISPGTETRSGGGMRSLYPKRGMSMYPSTNSGKGSGTAGRGDRSRHSISRAPKEITTLVRAATRGGRWFRFFPGLENCENGSCPCACQ